MSSFADFQIDTLTYPPAFLRVFTRALKRGENAFLAEGEPGTGKTTVGRLLGEYAQRKGGFFVFAQMNHWADDENLVRGVNLAGFVENDPARVYAAGVLLRALKIAQNTPFGVVLLDEWDKTRPAADSLLFSALQERMLVDASGRVWGHYPDGVVFWITSNNMRPLSPPLLRRAFRLEFPPVTGRVLTRMIHERTGVGFHVAKLLAVMANESRAAGNPLTLPDLLRMAAAIRDAEGVADVRFLLSPYGDRIPRRDPAADVWAAVGRDRKAKG